VESLQPLELVVLEVQQLSEETISAALKSVQVRICGSQLKNKQSRKQANKHASKQANKQTTPRLALRHTQVHKRMRLAYHDQQIRPNYKKSVYGFTSLFDPTKSCQQSSISAYFHLSRTHRHKIMLLDTQACSRVPFIPRAQHLNGLLTMQK
jgi:hypothetical protein